MRSFTLGIPLRMESFAEAQELFFPRISGQPESLTASAEPLPSNLLAGRVK